MPTPYKESKASPPDRLLRFVGLGLTPWRKLCKPVFLGLENIPNDKPVLFVGNHTLGGMFDVPLMLEKLYRDKGLFVRSLGDHFHFKIPGWSQYLQMLGTVEGTPDNCRKLMQAQEPILVFPGGGREVVKRKGEKYTLLWGQRMGFARLAIEEQYTIIPFAAVGAEECLDILVDADMLLSSPLNKIIQLSGIPEKQIPPIVRGIGPSMIPKPQRMYFKFGTPINTAKYSAIADKHNALELRDKTANSIENMIVELLDKRYIDSREN